MTCSHRFNCLVVKHFTQINLLNILDDDKMWLMFVEEASWVDISLTFISLIYVALEARKAIIQLIKCAYRFQRKVLTKENILKDVYRQLEQVIKLLTHQV